MLEKLDTLRFVKVLLENGGDGSDRHTEHRTVCSFSFFKFRALSFSVSVEYRLDCSLYDKTKTVGEGEG